jgi:hypothetical protein
LSVDVQTGLFDKQFFVPFTGNAVFADSFEIVLDNWDDGVDVQLSLDHGVQSRDIGWFDVSVWVGVTVGDDDDNLFSAGLFGLLDNLKDFLKTNVQERTFVESLQSVQFGRKGTVVQVFSEFNIHPGLFSVSDDGESGVFAQWVVVVNVSGDQVDSEFHFIPSVSDARGGIEKDEIVSSTGLVFWWFAIALAFAVGRAKSGWREGERCRHEAGEKN